VGSSLTALFPYPPILAAFVQESCELSWESGKLKLGHSIPENCECNVTANALDLAIQRMVGQARKNALYRSKWRQVRQSAK